MIGSHVVTFKFELRQPVLVQAHSLKLEAQSFETQHGK